METVKDLAGDPSLSFDKKRKQEMVAYSILFSLFERAYLLMFRHQEETFQLRQWSGWKHFLNDFIRREPVRTAWQLSKGTYDTGFQQFMDEKIAEFQSRPPARPGPVPVLPREPVPVPVS